MPQPPSFLLVWSFLSFLLLFFWSGSCRLRTGFQWLFLALNLGLISRGTILTSSPAVHNIVIYLIFLAAKVWISLSAAYMCSVSVDSERVTKAANIYNETVLKLKIVGFHLQGCLFHLHVFFFTTSVTKTICINIYKYSIHFSSIYIQNGFKLIFSSIYWRYFKYKHNYLQ